MISLGGVVVSRSIRVGGDELDEAIIDWVKKEYNLLLGERTADRSRWRLARHFRTRTSRQPRYEAAI